MDPKKHLMFADLPALLRLLTEKMLIIKNSKSNGYFVTQRIKSRLMDITSKSYDRLPEKGVDVQTSS